jgi:tRNA dimethylallyltransferase
VSHRQNVLVVVGPTASGKTDLAIALAQRMNGELISADSRQVYRHCDIGTNKPDAGALHGIRCHVIDVVDPGQPFTVADYQRLAVAAINEIQDRGRLPIVQGGTGLYVRALLDGWNLGDTPPDPALRARLEQRLETEGSDALEADLRRVDPMAADRAQRNPRRLIRSLEIYAATGQAPTAARRASPPAWRSSVLGLAVPLPALDRRIEARVDRMLADGLVDEVQRVRAKFPTADLGRLGHGYPEIANYLDGTVCLPDARQDIIKQVSQYARRQYTWFRADSRVHWIDPAGGPDAAMRLLVPPD